MYLPSFGYVWHGVPRAGDSPRAPEKKEPCAKNLTKWSENDFGLLKKNLESSRRVSEFYENYGVTFHKEKRDFRGSTKRERKNKKFPDGNPSGNSIFAACRRGVLCLLKPPCFAGNPGFSMTPPAFPNPRF
jgi:hypothetical protein